ncbi:VOC family protein [Bacillus sp. Marseille-Q1617]|uniref:VOC family protein n=1 Tax=Bacillus sp. Marseille-Q1617 TaxID=2736887 RepID=UPI00158F2EF8|nr:VOC family protein [Bacillus sp. Marseille-Q1617]
MSIFQGVMQTNMMVSDIEAAKNWYRDVLQAEIEKDYGTTVVLTFGSDSPSGTLCLIQDKEAAGENHSTYPVLQISPEFKDTLYEKLLEKDVEVEGDPAHRSHFKFYDPDGNRLEAYNPGIYEES